MALTILFYSALLSGFLPWSLLCFRKKTFVFRSAPVAPYLFYILVATLYELVATQIFRINTSYWFQLSLLLEAMTLFYFFNKITLSYHALLKNVVFGVVLIIYGLSFFLWKETTSLTPYAINHLALFLLVLTGLFLWVQRLFGETTVKNLWAYPDFYFVAGIAFYYFSTLFLFLFSRYIYEQHLGLSDFWLLNVVATLILRLTLTLGVWKIR